MPAARLLSLTALVAPLALPIPSVLADWILRDTPTGDALYDVTFLDGERGFAVGWGESRGAVILSTKDGGENWETELPVVGGYLFSVRFTSPKQGFAAGYDPGRNCGMILSTKNGGRRWKKTQLPETFGLYDLEFPSSKIGYACGYNGKIFRTGDGGRKWRALETGAGDRIFRWMSFADEDHGWAACGTEFSNSDRVYRTTDGGESWEAVYELEKGDKLTGLCALDADTVVASAWLGRFGGLLKSVDGGETWTEVWKGPGFPQGLVFRGETGYAVGVRGFVARTRDGGETWVSLVPGFQGMALAGAVTDDALVVVGADGLFGRLPQ
jgi:photosystem II stability/assembly factor-like uncharacterized protein